MHINKKPSHRDVKDAFLRICLALKRTQGVENNQWHLVARQEYYRIEVNTLGGKICPLGENWRTGKEFLLSATMALLSLYVYTEGNITLEP